jgi:hypothetical protein
LPWSDDPYIAFIGIKQTSEYGPTFMFRASDAYRLADFAERNPAGGLFFNRFPGLVSERFESPRMPGGYVPIEIAPQVVALLNGAMAAPFGRKKLQQARKLLSGSMPWTAQARVQRVAPWESNADPFSTSLGER